MLRSEYVATRENSLLLIIDFQQSMLKTIDSWEEIARKVGQLIRASNALGIPILLTEQYKKGLGETLPELLQEIDSPQIFQKEHFSACLERNFIPTVQSYNIKKIVVVTTERKFCRSEKKDRIHLDLRAIFHFSGPNSQLTPIFF